MKYKLRSYNIIKLEGRRMNEWVWSIFGIMIADQTGSIRGKPVQLPLGPSQFLHRIDRNRSQFSLVRGRRLEARALAGRLIAFDMMHSAHILGFISTRLCRTSYPAVVWYCHYQFRTTNNQLFGFGVESNWNVMAHGDAREGKWRGNWRMEWVASTLHATSEHGVSSINTADAHTSAASSRLNWRPPSISVDSSVSPKNEIWFLRVCHHISNVFYQQTCNLLHLSVTYACVWVAIPCSRYRTTALKPGCVLCLKAND